MANLNPQFPSRAAWLALLANAPAEVLAEAAGAYGPLPAYSWLRRPETGLAMVRARTGGQGAQFNLGDMSVTRCVLRLASGEVGVAYVAGRNTQTATRIALFDALLQTAAAPRVREQVLAPVEAAISRQRAAVRAQAQATRVDFMTLVRREQA